MATDETKSTIADHDLSSLDFTKLRLPDFRGRKVFAAKAPAGNFPYIEAEEHFPIACRMHGEWDIRRCTIPEQREILAMCEVVDLFTGSLARVSELEERRRISREETAKRWPELASEGWIYKETVDSCRFAKHGTSSVLEIDRCDSSITFESSGCSERVDVVLALIDAAGKNTTADRLREAIVSSLEALTAGSEHIGDAIDFLAEALNG